MRDEKERIISTVDGFSVYVVGQNGSRAKHLQAAYETMASPDEVWEDHPKARARWVYVNEYSLLPTTSQLHW